MRVRLSYKTLFEEFNIRDLRFNPGIPGLRIFLIGSSSRYIIKPVIKIECNKNNHTLYFAKSFQSNWIVGTDNSSIMCGLSWKVTYKICIFEMHHFSWKLIQINHYSFAVYFKMKNVGDWHWELEDKRLNILRKDGRKLLVGRAAFNFIKIRH